MEDLTLSSSAEEVQNSYRIGHHSLLERVMVMPSSRGKTGEPQRKSQRYLTPAWNSSNTTGKIEEI